MQHENEVQATELERMRTVLGVGHVFGCQEGQAL